jgi:hypothetical protein
MTVAAQILIARKAVDPTALTACDAIRTLLGYGDRLAELHRRDLLELHLGGIDSGLPASNGAWDSVATALESYLESTVSFWNPNRERAWVRIGPKSWEGGGTMSRPFGEPALDQPELDHLLVWSRDPGAPPPDLPAELGTARVLGAERGELYTFAWSGEPDERARMGLLEGVAVAQSRGRGLLVQPHYQNPRFILGSVPIPIWE